MHYKVRVVEIEQPWSLRHRLGVTGRVVGDNLNEEVGTGNLGVLIKKRGRGITKPTRESLAQAWWEKGMEFEANMKSQKQA